MYNKMGQLYGISVLCVLVYTVLEFLNNLWGLGTE
jgi:hypothetical protein